MTKTYAKETSIVENRLKDAEIRQLLLKNGIAVPNSWSPDSPGGRDVILAAVKTAALTKKRKYEKEAQQRPKDVTAATDDPTDEFTDIDRGQQFSECRSAPHGLHVTNAKARSIIAAKSGWRSRQ